MPILGIYTEIIESRIAAMTKLFCPLLLSVLGLCRCLPAQPLAAHGPTTPSNTAYSAIQAAYEDMGASFQAHDLNRFMEHFRADYIDIDENGRHLTREQTRQGYQDQLRQLKSIQSRYVVKAVQETPTGTLVEMRLQSKGTGEKRILFAKIRGHFTDDLRVRDLWVNTPQGWRLQRRMTLKDDLSTGR